MQNWEYNAVYSLQFQIKEGMAEVEMSGLLNPAYQEKEKKADLEDLGLMRMEICRINGIEIMVQRMKTAN